MARAGVHPGARQAGGIGRRKLIGLLGGAAAAWPVAARGQQTAMPVVGFLGASTPDLFVGRLRRFRQALSETGFVEGRNVAIEYRWANNQSERWPALSADLVRHPVSVIVTFGGNAAALAAKAATKSVPIVFSIGGDPVALGLVASLNRPGGNVTGITQLGVEVGQKRLELLHELMPAATTIALLINPTNPNAATVSRDLEMGAHKLGLQSRIVHARGERDFDGVFASLSQMRANMLVIGGDPLFNNRNEQLAALALRYSVPTIHQYREFAAAGGLVSYGASVAETDRLAGDYTGRILKGEKPADLPVQRVTKIELVLNLKSAKALGLEVPTSMLLRADEVIE